MKMILRILCLLLLVFGCLSSANVFAENVCFKCHAKKAFIKKIVHRPMANGKCGVCHNPHVAKFDKLLVRQGAQLCFSCHKKLKNKLQKGGAHAPVRSGQCLACHDPHSSQVKGLLKSKNIAATCFTCHKDLVPKYKVTHRPYARGQCSACHDPHQSGNPVLLKTTAEKLCAKCHTTRNLMKGHKNFPAKLKDCLSCHNPHGSKRKGLIRDVLHKPFADGCKDCHAKGRSGSDNCLRCHPKVREELYASHNHLTGQPGNGCVVCHSPHAGDSKGLFRGSQAQACRQCHEDTLAKMAQSAHTHPGLNDCSSCHAPHGSNQLAMMKTDLDAVCSACHETQGKFTHPVGDKVYDPRTGQNVTCVSCHDSMGTEYKFHLKKSGAKELCIQCHRSY